MNLRQYFDKNLVKIEDKCLAPFYRNRRGWFKIYGKAFLQYHRMQNVRSLGLPRRNCLLILCWPPKCPEGTGKKILLRACKTIRTGLFCDFQVLLDYEQDTIWVNRNSHLAVSGDVHVL